MNFLGGMDEEWFSAVHVAIEARSGVAVVDAAAAQRLGAAPLDSGAARRALAAKLDTTAESIRACVAILERMGERCEIPPASRTKKRT